MNHSIMGTNTPDNYLEEPPDDVEMETNEWLQLNYNQQYYRANKERREYIREQSKKNYNRNRNWLRDVKENESCRVCGEERRQTLDFHHVDDKKESVSKLVRDEYGLETIAKEIEKCVVLCSNCHRVYHDDELNKDVNNLKKGSKLSKEMLSIY